MQVSLPLGGFRSSLPTAGADLSTRSEALSSDVTGRQNATEVKGCCDVLVPFSGLLCASFPCGIQGLSAAYRGAHSLCTEGYKLQVKCVTPAGTQLGAGVAHT